MPWSRVRALSAHQAELFVNKRSEGMWKQAPPAMGGAHFRIINNTAICNGPWLAVFRDEPPPLNWPALPQQWLTHDGYIRLCVAKGTLVPTETLEPKRAGREAAMRASAKRRKLAEETAASGAATSTRYVAGAPYKDPYNADPYKADPYNRDPYTHTVHGPASSFPPPGAATYPPYHPTYPGNYPPNYAPEIGRAHV